MVFKGFKGVIAKRAGHIEYFSMDVLKRKTCGVAGGPRKGTRLLRGRLRWSRRPSLYEKTRREGTKSRRVNPPPRPNIPKPFAYVWNLQTEWTLLQKSERMMKQTPKRYKKKSNLPEVQKYPELHLAWTESEKLDLNWSLIHWDHLS